MAVLVIIVVIIVVIAPVAVVVSGALLLLSGFLRIGICTGFSGLLALLRRLGRLALAGGILNNLGMFTAQMADFFRLDRMEIQN